MTGEPMSASVSDVVTRRLLPRVVVKSSRADGLARLGASARHRLGRRGRVELYFAFDDPWSAVAVLDLAEQLRTRDVLLDLRPIVKRGIPGDPAVDLKRRYALDDARRLAARSGLALAATSPAIPGRPASWPSGSPRRRRGRRSPASACEAVRRLWFESDAAARPADFAELWREQTGGDPGPPGAAGRVRRNERKMCLRGIYDVPAAWVHGQWFFAHDRSAQIGARLDDLGWPAG